MAKPELDKFGRFIISTLRDSAIDRFEGLARGRWKSPSSQQLQAELAALTDKQRQLVRRCVIACIDTAVHDHLFALCDAHDFKKGIAVTVDGKNPVELSDGLQGEPFGESGWIAHFSKYPKA